MTSILRINSEKSWKILKIVKFCFLVKIVNIGYLDTSFGTKVVWDYLNTFLVQNFIFHFLAKTLLACSHIAIFYYGFHYVITRGLDDPKIAYFSAWNGKEKNEIFQKKIFWEGNLSWSFPSPKDFHRSPLLTIFSHFTFV